MGKIGKTYAGAGGWAQAHSREALQRFDPPLADPQERTMRREIKAAVVGLICLLGLIGWALTL